MLPTISKLSICRLATSHGISQITKDTRYGDQRKLRQAFSNFKSSAIKDMKGKIAYLNSASGRTIFGDLSKKGPLQEFLRPDQRDFTYEPPPQATSYNIPLKEHFTKI